MTINVERDYELVVLGISGRLDSTTASNLEKTINTLSEETKELVFDVAELEYVSSAGIRVFLGACKKMSSNKGTMRIEKANENVRKVFEMTGLMQMLLKG